MDDITQSFYDDLGPQYDRLFSVWPSATREQAVMLERIFLRFGFDRGAQMLDCACGIGI